MARWYGYSMNETRKLLMTEFAMFEEMTERHPPADLILAARYLERKQDQKPLTFAESAKQNRAAMALLPKEVGRHISIDQMPEYIRNNETRKKQREEMRAKLASGQ